MLIKISGGESGFSKYLREGQKQGRDMHRDELDERIPLAGDLDFFDSVVNNMQSEGDNYYHITLAFKEDNIPTETMQSIVEEFRQFMFSAYGADEYTMYAEAHNPKVKSYVNKKTADFAERKPHIHIGIPKTNLLSGMKMEPFGLTSLHSDYIDAFQEHINNKYGLASPKENIRVEFTDSSEMLSRYKGDFFKGSNNDFREGLLREVLIGQISDYEAFKQMLGNYGRVEIGRKGTEVEYLKIYRPGEKKAVRLSNYVFSREFVELGHGEKLQRLAKDLRVKYESAAEARRDPEHITRKLTVWHNTRAKEIKYLYSGTNWYKNVYQKADPATKAQLLAEKEQQYAERWRIEPEPIRPTLDGIRDNLRTASRHLGAAGRAAGNLDQGARNLAYRTVGRAVAAALGGRGRDQAESQPTRQRQAGDDYPERKRPRDNQIGRLQGDLGEAKTARRAAPDFAEIRQKMDGRAFLDYLSRTHGVLLEKYQVTKGKDGSDRIQCGTRALTVNDFLTRELHLSWKEAAPLLRKAYALQLGQQQTRQRTPAERELWGKFQHWRTGQVAGKAAEREALKKWRATALAAINARYKGESGTLRGSPAEKKQARDILKAKKSAAEMDVKEQHKAKLAALRQPQGQKGMMANYREFLQLMASNGDEAALAELRRQTEREEKREDAAHIKPATEEQQTNAIKAHKAPLETRLKYQVARDGVVTYLIDGRAELRDRGDRVDVLNTRNDEATLLALNFAVKKYGRELTVNGDADFQRRAVEIAVRGNVNCTFADKQLEAYRLKLLDTRAAEIAAKKKAAEEARKARQLAGAKLKPSKEKAQGEELKQAEQTPAAPAQEPVPEGTTAPRPGFDYLGEILEVTDKHVIQDVGRDKVAHPLASFKEVPEPGDVLTVNYSRDGQATVKTYEQGRSLGRGLGD